MSAQNMGNQWRECRLGDLFKVKHGFAFKGEYFTEAPQETVRVTPGNFTIGGGFQDGKRKFYRGTVPPDFVLKPGQVVVTMTDLSKQADTLGYAAIIPKDSTIWLHNQRIGLLEFKPDIPTSPRFIHYLLRTREYRAWIVGSASGSTVKHTAPDRIESFSTRIPPLAEQHAIAHILGTLDDKIALHRCMNQTLENMAQALFKSWFVDFDEVPPEDMQESELGWIPTGWRVKEIGNLVQCVGGATPSTKNESFWTCSEHHWATPKDFSKLQAPVLTTSERCITDAGLARISSGLLPAGTLLRSSRASIGYLAIAVLPVAINQGFIAMLPESIVSPLWLLFWAKNNMEAIQQRANGSTFMEISKTAFRSIQFAMPAPDKLAQFDAVAHPILERIISNERESRTLATLRDTLLPRLISGTLHILDAKRFMP